MPAVIEYVTEEVGRQGHDVTTLDGIERVGWMLQAWAYALDSSSCKPEFGDAVILGKLVEPIKNGNGIRLSNVRVGSRRCPDYDKVPALLAHLLARRDTLKPLEFYKEFELIHPFVDGNGRTGKVLLNWLNRTLLRPVFPPDDFWGHPILNP